MFQHFKMNVNIDVSLASTPKESFARVQGPSHGTATLSDLDELRMNCADSYGYQSAAAKMFVVIWDTLWKVLNGKTTISAEQNLKIQLRIPKKVRTRVKRIKRSPILEKPTWEFILTQVLFQNPLYEGTFSDAKCKMISYQSMITTPTAWSIPRALGSCPAHCLVYSVALSFGSKVKAVCAHINRVLCFIWFISYIYMVYYIIYTVSSAGDSHEQFPRSRSTHNIYYVAAIMTQSFIKSNYPQPLKLWQQRVEASAPHEKHCSTSTALLAWRL